MSAKAEELMKKARQKASSGGGLFGMFSDPRQKAEDAADLFKQAAIEFKLQKKMREAGDAYVEAGKMQAKAEVPHEEAAMYQEAAKCYKSLDGEMSLDVMRRAANVYLNMGKFSMAAKQLQKVAEGFEGLPDRAQKALEAYSQAAQYFESDDAPSQADKCRIKVAYLHADLGQYDEAYALFEDIAERQIENDLLKYGAKDTFFKAGLCRLAGADAIAAKRAIEGYGRTYAQFTDSREEKMLMGIVESIEDENIEKFEQTVFEFDRISKLDNWTTKILLKIKKGIGAADLL